MGRFLNARNRLYHRGSGLPALRMGCERDLTTAAGFTAGGVRCLRAVLRSQVGELPKSQLPAERAQMMAE